MAVERKVGRLYIGTSGYQYGHWRELFYPEGLPQREWFEHYARHFDTVEINNTFYQLPAATTFDNWRARAPACFTYALKLSRFITHLKRLKDPADAMATFVERARRLRQHLGPILVQLPPHWRVSVERLARFLDAAPRDLRWSLEFRDPSWLCEAVYEQLRSHGAALCIHDKLDAHPRVVTANFVYLRFHGPDDGGDYLRSRLQAEARRIAQLRAEGLDVYAYFNNDRGGYAVRNASDLRRYARG